VTQVLIDESLQTVVVEETATTVIVRAPGPAPAGAGTGTVTSVDASGGTTGLSFSGGPVTGAGTLTLAGTLAVASGGTGATDAATARGNLSAAVSGANSDITSMTGVTGGIASPDFITFDTGATTSAAVGRLRWDSANGTARLGMIGGNVESQLGQTIDALVHNAEATSLSKGEVVYLFSATGDRASVKRAANTGDATSAKTIGVVAESIAAGQNGLIRCQGVLDGLNLGAFTAGDTLYLGATAGTTTATKPVAPNHLVYVGVVERANAGNGQLYVRIQNGYELDELHDVLITSPAAGAVLSYDATNSLWKDTTIAGGAGITVTNADSSVTVATSGAVTSSGFTMSTARLLGRTTASTGAIEQITVGSGLSLSGGTLTATGGGSGTHADGDGWRLGHGDLGRRVGRHHGPHDLGRPRHRRGHHHHLRHARRRQRWHGCNDAHGHRQGQRHQRLLGCGGRHGLPRPVRLAVPSLCLRRAVGICRHAELPRAGGV